MRYVLIAALLLAPVPAIAVECPPGAKSCVVVTITPEELQTLIGQNMIFDMAKWASRPLGDITDAWRKKIETSPPGEVKTETPAPQANPQEPK